MENALPSKKILLLALVLIVVVSGIFVLQERNGSENNEPVADVSVVSPENDSSNDKDGDGLSAWQELLLGTDENNPDTDGDGTNDGDELNAGRDPLTAGPNDELTPEQIQNSPVRVASGNLTDEITNQLFAPAVVFANNNLEGIPLEERDINATVSGIANELEEEPLPLHPIEDIQTNNDNTEQAVRTYVNTIFDTLSKYDEAFDARGLDDELATLVRDLEKNNESDLAVLDGNIGLYIELKNELLGISTPSSMAPYHLGLINSYVGIIDSLEKMQDINDDLVKGSLGVRRYQTYQVINTLAINSLGYTISTMSN